LRVFRNIVTKYGGVSYFKISNRLKQINPFVVEITMFVK